MRKKKIAPPVRQEMKRPGKAGGKRDSNRIAKLQAIAENSFHLFVERGLDAVTIDEVVAEVGIAKGSFYRYYSSKADLVEQVYAPFLESLKKATEETIALLNQATDKISIFASYEPVITVIFSFVLEHPKTIVLYLQENRGPMTEERRPILQLSGVIDDLAVRLTKVAHEKNLLKTEIHSSVSAYAVVGACEKILLSGLREQDIGAADKAAEGLSIMMLTGCLQEEFHERLN